jgi:hypothetical protein
MVQIRESCQPAGPSAPRSSPLVWFALAVAAALLVTLAIAAAKSGGFDRLLPKDQPFAPYFTT